MGLIKNKILGHAKKIHSAEDAMKFGQHFCFFQVNGLHGYPVVVQFCFRFPGVSLCSSIWMLKTCVNIIAPHEYECLHDR